MMDTQTILIFLIFADAVLCIAVIFLLARLGKNISRPQAPVHDGEQLLEFRRLLGESQDAAAGFLRTLDINCNKFKELASELEEKERSLTALIREMQKKSGKFKLIGGDADDPSSEKKHNSVKDLLRAGLSLEEISARSGLPAGEVSLIIDLERNYSGR
ncbi:MAG TPA: hypothetical protein VJZ49_07480 [Syntrophales bacterium]|nr:hypothetical protein [Syntrophales bacterium]